MDITSTISWLSAYILQYLQKYSYPGRVDRIYTAEADGHAPEEWSLETESDRAWLDCASIIRLSISR